MKLPLLPKPEAPKQKTARAEYQAHFAACFTLHDCPDCARLQAAANFEREEAMRAQESR